MSDGYLMDSTCIHGEPWYECQACWDDLDAALVKLELDELDDNLDFEP